MKTLSHSIRIAQLLLLSLVAMAGAWSLEILEEDSQSIRFALRSAADQPFTAVAVEADVQGLQFTGTEDSYSSAEGTLLSVRCGEGRLLVLLASRTLSAEVPEDGGSEVYAQFSLAKTEADWSVSGFSFEVLAAGPSEIVLSENSEDEESSAPGPAFSVFPNPANASLVFQISSGPNERWDISVFDVQGHRIADLGTIATGVEGMAQTRWNGRSDRGEEQSSGVYFVRADNPQRGHMNRKILLLK